MARQTLRTLHSGEFELFQVTQSSTLIQCRFLAAATVVTFALVFSGFLSPVEQWLRDSTAKTLLHRVSSDIAIIEIDARSIQAIGSWPWPRGYYTELIDRLATSRINKLFIDIDFSADREQQQDDIFWQSLQLFSDRHQLLLPAFLQTASLSSKQLLLIKPPVEPSPTLHFVSVNIKPASDGLVRETASGFSFNSATYKTAGIALSDSTQSPGSTHTIIDFSIHPSSFEYISFIDVLNGDYDISRLNGRNVLLGATAIELGDNVAVPVYGSLPGVVVQALIAETHSQGPLKPHTEFSALLMYLPVLVACGFLINRLSWGKALASTLAICSLWFMAGLYLRFVFRVQPVLVAPLLFFGSNYLLSILSKLDHSMLETMRLKLSLLSQNSLLKTVFNAANDYILCVDENGLVSHASQSICKLMKADDDTLLHQPVNKFLPEYEQLFSQKTRRETQLCLLDDTAIPVEISINPICVANDTSYALIIRDQRERIQREAKLRHKALHDELTTLPNRAHLFKSLEKSQTETEGCTLLLLDLSLFKEVNDQFGHRFGDQVLVTIAGRIRSTTETIGSCYRLDGDEFAVIYPADACRKDIEKNTNALIEAVCTPVDVDGCIVEICLHAGAAHFSPLNMDTTSLLRNADLALQRAKKSNEIFVWFDPQLDARSVDNLRLIPMLRSAISNDELKLVFQPKVSLSDNSVRGTEMLLRWPTNSGKHITPDIFIPVAENARLIDALLLWSIDQLLNMELYWAEHKLPSHVAVNLSAQLLSNASFIEQLIKLVNTSVGYFKIEFEITESSLMVNRQTALKSIAQLRNAGFDIAIDDYGTGYSSLSYIRDLGANTLKIDKAFISDIVGNEDNQIIVRSTISMARELGLKVVAEGIEHTGQAELLKRFGCNIGQGYLYSKPIDAKQLRSGFITCERWQDEAKIIEKAEFTCGK